MTTWKDSVALSASAPIRYQDKIVGVVLTGVLVDKGFVESLSRPGAEVAIFYGNRLVVNSFKDLPESALNQMQRSKDLAASASGAGSQIQTLSLGPESYTIEFLPLEGEEKPWENLIVVGVNRRELEPTLLTLKLVIFGVGGASAVIGILLSFWLSSGMRRQIAHLAEGHPPGGPGGTGRGYPRDQPGRTGGTGRVLQRHDPGPGGKDPPAPGGAGPGGRQRRLSGHDRP